MPTLSGTRSVLFRLLQSLFVFSVSLHFWHSFSTLSFHKSFELVSEALFHHLNDSVQLEHRFFELSVVSVQLGFYR